MSLVKKMQNFASEESLMKKEANILHHKTVQ
jgi:hypothetical protein